MPRSWGSCAVCGKVRELRKARGGPMVVKEHNRWSAELKKMVYCIGSGREPRTPVNVTFRS